MCDQAGHGEIAIMLKDLADDIREIKEQTKITNGRVSKLESVKNMAIGGLVVTNLLVIPVIVAIASNYFSK